MSGSIRTRASVSEESRQRVILTDMLTKKATYYADQYVDVAPYNDIYEVNRAGKLSPVYAPLHSLLCL